EGVRQQVDGYRSRSAQRQLLPRLTSVNPPPSDERRVATAENKAIMRRASFRARKILLSLAALGAAASIAGLGTFATFTSSTSTHNTNASRARPATAPVSLLGTGANPIAPGDTIQRAVDLSYSDALSFASATLPLSAA